MERPRRPIIGRPRRSRTLALGMVALLAASIGAAPATAQDPNVLKVATTANITTWDPVASFSTEAFYLANIYEPLLWINPPGSDTPYTPALATEWKSSDDGLTWTFQIRPGVTFHDGDPLTADAVVASIEAARTRAGASFIWAPLDTVTATGPLTVEMKLKYPAAMDLIASSLYGAWIVSPKSLEAANALYAYDPTADYYAAGIDGGTGPYTIKSYTPDSEVLLAAYPEYWGGWKDTQHYDQVLVSITPESINQQQALDGGDVDIAFNVPLENLDSYKSNPDYTIIDEPSFFNYVGLFNTGKAPFDDPKVRQALSYAIPYDDIIKIGAQTYGTQSHGPVPAGVFPYDETVPQYHQDLDKAKALLKEAGHEGGGFSMEITYASENQAEARFAPLLQDAFGQLGIDVTLTPMLFNQQWARAKGDAAGRQDMFLLLYWPTYSDAGSDNLWSLFHSSDAPFFNLSYWNDKKYDGLIDDAGTKTATDRPAAQAGYSEAMKYLVDQAPGAFFYDTREVFPLSNKIAGYQYNLNYPFAQFFYPLHPAQ
jgi:peptide/nickel transport system substrate-binding protein